MEAPAIPPPQSDRKRQESEIDGKWCIEHVKHETDRIILEPLGVYLCLWKCANSKPLTRHCAPVHMLRWHGHHNSTVYSEYDSVEELVFLGMGETPSEPAWIGMHSIPESQWSMAELKLSSDPSSEWVVFVCDGVRTLVYTNMTLSVPTPPWDMNWGKMELRSTQTIPEIPLADARHIVFYYYSQEKNACMVWQLHKGQWNTTNRAYGGQT